jgi:hypothetical protein
MRSEAGQAEGMTDLQVLHSAVRSLAWPHHPPKRQPGSTPDGGT